MTNDVQISEREREILRLVATGATNQQIAQQLNISINTVKVHLRNIFGKIGAVSRTEATVYAIRNGLVTVGADGDPAERDLELSPPVATLELPAPAAPALVASPPTAPPPALATVTPEATAAPAPPPARAGGGSRRGAMLLWGMAAAVAIAAIALLVRGALAPAPLATPAGATTAPAATPTSRWFARAPLPTPRQAFATTAFDLERELYVIGGRADGVASGAVDRYDPARDRWVSLADKPTPVSSAGAAALRGKIYVPGGEDSAGKVLDILEIYDPREGRWEEGPPLPAPRSRFALIAWEGQLYLIGGWDGQEARGEVYIFDPETGNWVEGPPLTIPRRDAGAAVAAGRLFVVGGEGADGPLREGLELEPGAVNGAGWSGIAPLPRPIVSPAIVAPVGNLLVFDPAAREGLQYDQTADAWSPIAMPAEATLGSAVAQLDPSIYFIADADDPTPGALSEYRAVYTVFLPGP